MQLAWRTGCLRPARRAVKRLLNFSPVKTNGLAWHTKDERSLFLKTMCSYKPHMFLVFGAKSGNVDDFDVDLNLQLAKG